MAKAKGKEKPAASDVPVEMEQATADDITAKPTPSKLVKTEEAAETTDTGYDKTDEAEEKDEATEEKSIDAEMTPVVPETERAEEEDRKEDVKVNETVGNSSNKKAKRMKRKKKAASNNAGVTVPNDAAKPETSAAEKTKIVSGMGLIFMCNSKTKKDCYQYKVLGLPESKKDMVAKVYKGMRLFLFDVELKLMYGIYKAASPGGYNIEPKAFKSAFPSQVRFSILNDCNPLPEETFKAAIKSNYYGRSKFNCLLSPEQVKNLCKLFVSESKTSVKRQGGIPKEPRSAGRDQKRRLPHGVRNNERYPRRPAVYPREAYISPPPRPVVMTPRPPVYSYDRPVDDYYYRRDEPLEFRDLRAVETRPSGPIYLRDPYSSYREPVSYSEPLYPASLSSAYARPPPPYPF